MKNKEIRIQVPPGMCIDEENSTFECIKFKPKELTYEDITKKLFLHENTWFIGTSGNIIETDMDFMNCSDPNNSVSRKQCERLLAINKLMNVAHYFNEIVDKDVDDEYRYYFLFDDDKFTHVRIYGSAVKQGIVSFKTKKSIEKAIKILGEETIKLAISL